jgi:hypothetical protein
LQHSMPTVSPGMDTTREGPERGGGVDEAAAPSTSWMLQPAGRLASKKHTYSQWYPWKFLELTGIVLCLTLENSTRPPVEQGPTRVGEHSSGVGNWMLEKQRGGVGVDSRSPEIILLASHCLAVLLTVPFHLCAVCAIVHGCVPAEPSHKPYSCHHNPNCYT